MQFKPMSVKQQGFTIIELVVVILLLGILAATALPRFIDVTTEAHDSVFEATAGGLTTGVALYRAEWTARGQPAANSVLQSYGGLRAAPGYSDGAYVEYDNGVSDSTFISPANYTGRSSGYPLATDNNINKATVNPFTAMSSLHCVQVFENILQEGAPTVARMTDNLGAVTTAATDLTAVDSSSEANLTTFRNLISTSASATPADFTALLATISTDTGFAALDDAGATLNAGGEPNWLDEVPACVFAYSGEAENFERFILYVPWTGRVQTFASAEALIEGSQYDGFSL